jgi:hypothetical protein
VLGWRPPWTLRIFRADQREGEMAEKSPQKPTAKKPQRSLKEKRAAKKIKSEPAKIVQK